MASASIPGGVLPDVSEAFESLSPREKQEVGQFLRAESQKVGIQQAIHGLTDKCFAKCVTSKITAGQLDRYEKPCLENCAQRFMDMAQLVIEQMRSVGDKM